MSAGTVLILAVTLGIVALNAYASFTIFKSQEVARSKKRAQLLFVWLIPILGAIIALAVYRPPPSGPSSIEDVSADDGIRLPGQLSNYDD